MAIIRNSVTQKQNYKCISQPYREYTRLEKFQKHTIIYNYFKNERKCTLLTPIFTERNAVGPSAKRQGDVFLEIPHKWAWEGI